MIDQRLAEERSRWERKFREVERGHQVELQRYEEWVQQIQKEAESQNQKPQLQVVTENEGVQVDLIEEEVLQREIALLKQQMDFMH